jgi:hypothetical protein
MAGYKGSLDVRHCWVMWPSFDFDCYAFGSFNFFKLKIILNITNGVRCCYFVTYIHTYILYKSYVHTYMHKYVHSSWSHLTPEQTFPLSDGTPC